jgi:uncharacterized membrane protein
LGIKKINFTRASGMNVMIIELFAFAAAFCYTISGVFAAKGMNTSNPITATLVSMITNNVLLWPFAFFQSSLDVNMEAVIFIAFSSLLAPTAGRMLNFLAIERVGVSTSGPILGSQPLFVALFAVFLLNERLPTLVYVGILITVIGIMVIALANRMVSRSVRITQKRYIMFPLLAAICFSLSGVLRKMGLNIQNDPVLAAAETSLFGIVSFFLLLLSTGKFRGISLNRRSIFFF